MSKKQILASLLTIAMANPNGYTVDAVTLQPITSGYAVAVADTQDSFGDEGLASVVDFVTTHNVVNAFGGWYDSETGRYYHDATVIVDSLDEAMKMARKNQQLAIFHLDTLTEIRVTTNE